MPVKFCLAGEYPLDASRIEGGVAQVVYTLADTIREFGEVDLHVVTFAKGFKGVRVETGEGITVHYVGSPTRRLVPNLLTMVPRLAKVIGELQPDVVNSHHAACTLAAKQAGVKVFHTIHGVSAAEVRYAQGMTKIARLIQAWQDNKAVRAADGVMGVSQYALDCYKDVMQVAPSKIDVPVEDNFHSVPELAEPKGVLFVGGIKKLKNLLTAIGAMGEVIKTHPDAKLWVCGAVSDQHSAQMMNRLFEVNLSRANSPLANCVEFMGVVDRTRIAELLEKSACLIHPSRQESSPCVIAQSMTAGRAVVASPVGGIPEMVEEGITGWLIAPDDVQGYAMRLTQLLSDHDLARKMGQAAREAARDRYNRRRIARLVLEICGAV